MPQEDVEDDLEELRAARVRMMRPEAVWLHKISHVLNEESLPRLAGRSAKSELGIEMTEDPYRMLMQDYGDVLKSGAEYGPGWIPLVRRMLAEMIGALKAAGFQRADLRIMQMKEKRGTLRCYYRAPMDLERIVDKYEDKSAVICEQCGALGHMRTGMYITCICDSCARKYEVEKTESGRLIRIGDYLRKLAPQPGFMPDRDIDAEADARLGEQMRRAHEQSTQPMATQESIAFGSEFMRKARIDGAAALQERIARGELLTAEAFQRATGMSADALDEAERGGRVFSILGPDCAAFYPAFYVDLHYDRQQIELVAQQLAGLPPTVKYHFFVSRAFTLGSKTPLEALLAGRLDDVLRAAIEYAER
jgi:hypothetical protein